MESPSQELAKAIAVDRARMDVAQDVVAEHMGVSQQAVSGWEDGKSFPRKKRLEMLVEYFGDESETAKVAAKYAPTIFTSYHNPGESRPDASGEVIDKLWNSLVEAKKTGQDLDHFRPVNLKKEFWDDLVFHFKVDDEHVPAKKDWVIHYQMVKNSHSKPTAHKVHLEHFHPIDHTTSNSKKYVFQSWSTSGKDKDEVAEGLMQAKYGIMLARQALDNAAEKIDQALEQIKR